MQGLFVRRLALSSRLYSTRPPARTMGDWQQNSGQGYTPRPRRPEAAPGTKIFVGNLSWNSTNESLFNAFGAHGSVVDAVILNDRETGRSRGFGFVTMASPEEANAAISTMDGSSLDGRSIRVNLATARA
ncbi:hypothetical protein SmJEL517_g01318 [Synchytrium microbalum]|uniref:RRM domain-containing protein n=1 Tax=Synchytrium microbalum TaxID=1806994 RepID=A0A507CAW1_9FUNG|nr:uncharacterized protein SmJEL517_g01318 [Synchytrium microbalum]TPX36488.1 hypothetical protein SmJEL517_g01318 [Synchytrium microbalum]